MRELNELYNLLIIIEEPKVYEQKEIILCEKTKRFVSKDLRKKGRWYKLTKEDKEDIEQESYFILKQLVTEKKEIEYAKELQREINRFLRKNYKYKSKEKLVGVFSDDKYCSYQEPTIEEDYSDIIIKISKTPLDSYISTNIIKNRIINQNFTQEQIALFYCTSTNKIQRLEQKIKKEMEKRKI